MGALSRVPQDQTRLKCLIDEHGQFAEPTVELLSAGRDVRVEAAAKLNELLSLLLEQSYG